MWSGASFIYYTLIKVCFCRDRLPCAIATESGGARGNADSVGGGGSAPMSNCIGEMWGPENADSVGGGSVQYWPSLWLPIAWLSGSVPGAGPLECFRVILGVALGFRGVEGGFVISVSGTEYLGICAPFAYLLSSFSSTVVALIFCSQSYPCSDTPACHSFIISDATRHIHLRVRILHPGEILHMLKMTKPTERTQNNKLWRCLCGENKLYSYESYWRLFILTIRGHLTWQL